MVARVRTAKLPMGRFVAFTKLVRLDCNDSSILFSFSIDAWMSIATKFNSDPDTLLPERAETPTLLKGELIESPEGLIDF